MPRTIHVIFDRGVIRLQVRSPNREMCNNTAVFSTSSKAIELLWNDKESVYKMKEFNLLSNMRWNTRGWK